MEMTSSLILEIIVKWSSNSTDSEITTRGASTLHCWHMSAFCDSLFSTSVEIRHVHLERIRFVRPMEECYSEITLNVCGSHISQGIQEGLLFLISDKMSASAFYTLKNCVGTVMLSSTLYWTEE
jgi:hypothetical protein